jgi:hypothetical protein
MEPITFDTIPNGVWLLTAVGLLALLLYFYRFQVSYNLNRLSWYIPLAGKLARKTTRAEKLESDFWFDQELELLDEFYQWITKIADELLYDTAVTYLNSIGELGRKATPVVVWLIIGVMMLVEAGSFGLIITPKIAPASSLDHQTLIGYAIGFVLAVALLALTHSCGRELYKNSVIQRIRSWYLDRPISEQNETLRIDSKVDLAHNDIDENRPPYNRAYNRLDISGPLKCSYWMTILCIVAVIALAWYGYQSRMAMYQNLESFSANEIATGNPLLAEIDQSQPTQPRDNYAAEMVYGTVTIIFLLLQIGGVTIGFRYGFVGKQSPKAAILVGGFSNKNDWLEVHNLWRNHVIDQTQALLSKLQARLRLVANGPFGDVNARTVATYLRQREAPRNDSGNVSTPPSDLLRDKIRRIG